ncbi:sensor histidine kinase [[Clostridium] hylemonae]|uniref:histidine kinase n=1 Tax=[Clostridium] hylemonae DSM 15053 TaxID=553973 RepID=C0BXX6_9FIRM|nr:sensor histidine kinase [[Clostridium] hylemonae]EEG75221.1 histidine kinase [[Clostridium] hylemonae DSM 15053]QEK18072.1 Sensor protein VraS [[Clostridium] hylemonae DSM 15053]
MKRILDQLVLLIFSFTTILLMHIDTAFIISFLTAVIYISANYFVDSRKFHFLSSAFYILLAVFFPVLLYFLPAVLYTCLWYDNYIGLAAVCVTALCRILPLSWPLFLLLAFGCGISLLLCFQTDRYEQLEQRFKQTRDDSTERNLLLKEKNHALLENQDYEVYTATLKERNRIAREIHDNVGHMLTRSILMTGAIRTVNKEPALESSLIQLEETLNTAMTNVRESVHDLHDESINLKEALTGLTDTFTFCPIHLDYDMGYDVPRGIKYSFITIVKEALNNIIRHSNATDVHIIVREHPGLYQLVIEDNGTVKSRGSGLGLTNMKDRVETLRGTMQLQTEKGFRIFITIPKRED